MSKKGNSVFEDIINVFTQASTFGAVGFEADNGGITSGVTTDFIGEGVKEVTGVNAAEDANKLAREQFEQNKADILAAKEDERRQNAADQLKSSNLAAGVRRRSSKSTVGAGSSSTVGTGEKDFLGL